MALLVGLLTLLPSSLAHPVEGDRDQLEVKYAVIELQVGWEGEEHQSHQDPDWTRMSPNAGPPGVGFNGMVYAAATDRVILFGGEMVPFGPRDFANQTWAYDFESDGWPEKLPLVSPPARAAHTLAYDTESNRAILFGGFDALGGPTDTWAYDDANNTWTDLRPATAPPPRWGHAMAYDAESDRVILFAGQTTYPPGGGPGSNLEDTWAFDFNTNAWTNLQPSIHPPPMHLHAMAYDAESDRTILFGGGVPPPQGVLNETWSYDFNTNAWEKLNPNPRPAARDSHAMAYDGESDRVVLQGGRPAGASETWTYDFNADSWTDMNSPSPPSYTQHALAYDAQSDRTILFGGYRDETWAYNLLSNHATAPRNPQASEGDEEIRITWEAPATDAGSPVTNYRVYRGTVPRSGEFLADASAGLTFTDANVTFGVEYHYQIGAVNGAGESVPSEEVSITLSDTQAPLIAITSPQDGATLSALEVAVSGTVSDNGAVERVEISADGEIWTRATGLSDWSGVLTLQEGSNTVYARAFDSFENMGEASVAVSVTNPLVPSPPPPLWLIIAILGAGIGTVAVTVFLLRRRNS